MQQKMQQRAAEQLQQKKKYKNDPTRGDITEQQENEPAETEVSRGAGVQKQMDRYVDACQKNTQLFSHEHPEVVY